MKQLPLIRVKKAPPWQRRRLARWLAQWTIDKDLPRVNPPKASNRRVATLRGRSPSLAMLRLRAPAVGITTEVTEGQIRLLDPQIPAARNRLLYVAVLREGTLNRFVISPFGKFAEPGLLGEWLTGRSEPSLRVLCLWNARSVPGSIFRNSWVVDRFSRSDLADAQAVWDSLHEGVPLPAPLEKQVGPPMVHPLDPRRDYVEEERSLMDAIESFADTGATGTVSFSERPEDVPSELALAAESRGTYGTVSRFRVEATGLTLQFTVGPEPTQGTVLIVDENGRPARTLDGSVLQAPDETRSPAIFNARVIVPRDFLRTGVVVVTPTGARLSLRRVR
jgi:hypothetical protein